MNERVHIGPAGWMYPDWSGVVYPARVPAGFDKLEFIASYFNLIEINSTFYRIPSPDTARRWADRIAGHESFVFTAKAHQSFTHDKTPPGKDALIAYAKAVAPLQDAGRLRAVLVQYPWSFRYDADGRRRIDNVCAGLSEFPLAIEVRHGSWASEAAVAYLADKNVTMCGIDQPVIGDSLTPRTHHAGPAGPYYRLHGRNAQNWFRTDAGRDARYDYLYTPDQLEPWARRIVDDVRAGRSPLVVLNNHFRGQAPANALELKANVTGKRVRVPRRLHETFPRLAEVALPEKTPKGQTGWLFDPAKGTGDDGG